MKKNNAIITAPSCRYVEGLYQIWTAQHTGTRDDFYDFMTSPSDERSAFMETLEITRSIDGNCIINNITA